MEPAAVDDPVPAAAPAPVVIVVPTPTSAPSGQSISLPVSLPGGVFDDVPGLLDLSTSIAVIGTNLFLSLLVIACLLLATTIFNATLKENEFVLTAAPMALVAPVLQVPGSIASSVPPLARVLAGLKPLRLLLLLVATAAIYGALDPSFGWNTTSAVLFISLAVGLAATTFLYEGAAVLLSSKRFGVPAEMKVFPLALLIAAVSVILSRVTGFHPGVIFGFVSAAAISGHGDRRHQGLIVWLPLCGLLAVSLLALVLISPLRDWGNGSTSVWATLPETIAIAIFVGGAQSVLLTLVPLTFNDGRRVWEWSKIAWLALSLPACFVFFHSLVNSDSDMADLSGGAHFGKVLVAAFAILVAAIAVWLFFKIRTGRLRSL